MPHSHPAGCVQCMDWLIACWHTPSVRYWVMGPEMGEKVRAVDGSHTYNLISSNRFFSYTDCRFPLSYGRKLHQSWHCVATEYSSTVCGTTTMREFPLILLDLYGRGYSDAPQMTYDPNLYTIQLALLMQHLRWDKAAIIRVSMGGGIAAAFSAQFPHLVNDKLILIASAGLMEISDISRTVKFMSSPLIQTLASSTPVQVHSSSFVAYLN